jgi:hypothetical protein
MLLVWAQSGCIALSPAEKNTVYELKSYGVETEAVRIKEPATAAWLNLLPGVGHFYLAYGSDERGLAGIGFFNLVTWPVSWFWGIPGAYSDAKTMNKKELVRFYQYVPRGQEELSALRKKYRKVELGLPEVDNNDGRLRAS